MFPDDISVSRTGRTVTAETAERAEKKT